MIESHSPISRSLLSQRTRLHYLDWGNAGAPRLLLIHGGRDHAHSWDRAALRLRHDFHVIAPDLRGHGDSEWSTDGAYNIPGFVMDLAGLVDQLGDGPVAIVAHSLGAVIALRYAGVFPERVSRLVAIEGIGAVPEKIAARLAAPAEVRWADWIEQRRRIAARTSRRFASFDEAVLRMREGNPTLDPEQVRHLAHHGVRQHDDGAFTWKFDPFVRAPVPLVSDDADSRRLWGRIACPVLLAWGRRGWGNDPLDDGTLDHFRDARAAAFDGGHWLHHDCHEEFVPRVAGFLTSGT